MATPPYTPSSQGYPGDEDHPSLRHRHSAPPAVNYFSGTFSGAHGFQMTNPSFFNDPADAYNTHTTDRSHMSNFNNTRNTDFRGSTHYTNTFQGDYNDNRQSRSQNYTAVFPEHGGGGQGHHNPFSGVNDHNPSRINTAGPPRRRDDNGGMIRSRETVPQREQHWGPAFDSSTQSPINTGPGVSRWREDDDDRMVRSREAVPQREQDWGLTFDSTRSQNQSSGSRRTSRGSSSGRGMGPQPISTTYGQAGAPQRLYSHPEEEQQQHWQEQRQPPYSAGAPSSPRPSFGFGSGDNYTPNAPTVSRHNPFRAASVPNPVSRSMSGGDSGPSPGRSNGAGPSSRNPWTAQPRTARGVPSPRVIPEENEDVEMMSPEEYEAAEGRRNPWEGSGPGRFNPRPDRSYTTG
ncbi:hypothetical protein GYMLUDRAFT_44850 [Collybiopsis luxurians FD-317 M1]|uniref:Uncharacterized protein n=1 Tax=Collybiopsis luxurians FD-317 M1 TaxID=944289 RepID=A0A0D0CTM3_9AGAR|nr:hypothetical protein GYMLUDRAFT_44850 [Collybiopsis luxurians FD-317 M1]